MNEMQPQPRPDDIPPLTSAGTRDKINWLRRWITAGHTDYDQLITALVAVSVCDREGRILQADVAELHEMVQPLLHPQPTEDVNDHQDLEGTT